MNTRLNLLTGGVLRTTAALIALCSLPAAMPAAQSPQPADLASRFALEIRPLLERYCLGCHSTEQAKGDLDLERFRTFADLLAEPRAWTEVVNQLELGEMPPKKEPQLNPAERERLLASVSAALDEATTRRAGDPGPVVLRRLNNAEYAFTIRDLTGVPELDPAADLPADTAAGEGFLNTGQSLVMSPALLAKYFDAAKDIARHAVLTPDGFRFSKHTTRRDWTEELLGEIRGIYRRYSLARGADRVNLQGVVFDTNEGGRLPVEDYLSAALHLRAQLAAATGPASAGIQPRAPRASPAADAAIRQLAAERGLSAKYLTVLWGVLHDGSEPSFLLDRLRRAWPHAASDDIPRLADEIARWQGALWKFSSVGHLGKAGGPKAWMEPINPLVAKQEFKLRLGTDGSIPREDVVLHLVASDAGDGTAGDVVVWERPRLRLPGRPDLLLRDTRDFIVRMSERRQRVFAATARSLAAADELEAARASAGALPNTQQLAERHGVDAEALSAWLDCLGIGTSIEPPIAHLTNRIASVAGYDFVRGWGSPETPNAVANGSDQAVRIPGSLKPRGVALHPAPNARVAGGWRSPFTGGVRVRAKITHAHPECGNGVTWSLEWHRGRTRRSLASGTAQGNRIGEVLLEQPVAAQPGDMVSLLVGPRDGNHACDLTDVDLALTRLDDPQQSWDLAREVTATNFAQNPHADAAGRERIWHFYSEPVGGAEDRFEIPSGSLLALWQGAERGAEKQRLAGALQELLLGAAPPAPGSPDAQLLHRLSSLGGPLFAHTHPAATNPSAPVSTDPSAWALPPEAFGKDPAGRPIEPADLCTRVPSVIEVRLPAELVAEAEFVATGTLDRASGTEGSVQLQARTTPPEAGSGLVAGEANVSDRTGPWTSSGRQVSHATPVIVHDNSAARKRFEAGFDAFRRWFPPALCYVKIVPVDEVVTLTLFHREDEPLTRLMLDAPEAQRLDRLWDELRYVSRDALTLVDAFEQLWQYATQDADPKVFEPLRQPIADRAAAFRQLLLSSEARHLERLLEFASRAFRRPLAARETDELRALYASLRGQDLEHEDALRLTLARVLVAPAFLYRVETPPPGTSQGPVNDWELATRLSYFLWSSAPDDPLRAHAAAARLRDPAVLLAETKRLLGDPRVRRLATEFASAWLHLYDFEATDEKSSRHFPGFADLRHAMHEEVVRYFTDLVQNDGSVLALFDSDYTFVNAPLAAHYGLPSTASKDAEDWRRVDGVRHFDRGGVLGWAAILAKQSGASRSSPILRGNWVAEVLLGEKLPRPPKDVPRLPEDEAAESLTVRQLTERHSSDPRCAGCHARIDGYGFALEGFDAIGRRRNEDLSGRAVETRATVFDGTTVNGAAGLRAYLLSKKRDVLLLQFSRKLLGYALGRGVLLSDKPLLADMQRQLQNHDFRFSTAVETIVLSRQFREIRGQEMARTE
jgi:hypothetical protein